MRLLCSSRIDCDPCVLLREYGRFQYALLILTCESLLKFLLTGRARSPVLLVIAPFADI